MERYLNNFLVYLDGFDILILKIKQIIKKIILMYFFLKYFTSQSQTSLINRVNLMCLIYLTSS